MTKYGAGAHTASQSLPSRALYAFVRACVVGFCRAFWRLRVTGREHVPKRGPFVLAPGAHRSNIDTLVSAAVTRRRLRFMGKDSLWKYGWSAWALTSLGGFPVQRDGADREAMRITLEVLEAGEPVVMFPEGTRLEGPTIDAEDMHDGPAYVAARAGVPIVPVGIGGGAGAMPVGSKGIRPVKMALVIGEPIPPPPASQRGRVSRQAVRAQTEHLRQVLQDLFDEAQTRVGEPNPPRGDGPVGGAEAESEPA